MTNLQLSKKQPDEPEEKGKFSRKTKFANARCHQVRGRTAAKDTVNSEQSNHTLACLGGLAAMLFERSGQGDSLWSQGHVRTQVRTTHEGNHRAMRTLISVPH